MTIWPSVGWTFLLLVRAAMLRFRRQGRIALVTAAGALLLLVATTEWAPLLRAARPRRMASRVISEGGLPLRIVVWNVSGAAPLADLESLDPDVCFLQEIGDLDGAVRRSARWSERHVLEGFDPGIVSRYPLRRVPAEKVGPWTEPLTALVELPGGRRLVAIDVRLALPALAAGIGAPGEWGGLAKGHAERLAQFPRLAALSAQAQRAHSADAVILAGDFNTPAGMASLAPLRPLLRDVWPSVGVGWGATMTAEMPLSRIDQCWISERLTPVAAHVERRGASDHRLLVVDLRLK